MKRSTVLLSSMVMGSFAVLVIVGPAAARGPDGGGGGGFGNAGGAVRGRERAEQMAAPQGQLGIDNAESRIDRKNNPRNPNSLA